MSLNDLKGRVAFVTGANRDGIGRAIARRLAAHGADVVLHSSGARSPGGLDESRELIEAAGGRAACVTADLSDGDARADLIERAAAFFGPIDILINNAARLIYAPPSKIDWTGRDNMFELNFQAPIDLTQQALPSMREKGWGRIVNISTDAINPPVLPFGPATTFSHKLALYGASKVVLDRYSQGLAHELQGTGITVSVTKPHGVSWSSAADAIAQQTLAGRPDLVEPLEMLAEAVYLLVDRGITGVVMNSREILQLVQSPLHALDGVTVIGDATLQGRVDA